MHNPNDVNDFEINIQYVRGVHEDVLGWYKNADNKAQIILTLNGVFITFVTTSLFRQDVLFITQLPWYTLALLVFMTVSLTISLYSSIACLWSRIFSKEDIDQYLSSNGVDINDYHTYKPRVCWFFQFVSVLKKDQFEERMRNLEPRFEVDVLASQIYELSKNVSKKHRYVNFGFTFAALTFMFFVMSGLSYIIFLQK